MSIFVLVEFFMYDSSQLLQRPVVFPNLLVLSNWFVIDFKVSHRRLLLSVRQDRISLTLHNGGNEITLSLFAWTLVMVDPSEIIREMCEPVLCRCVHKCCKQDMRDPFTGEPFKKLRMLIWATSIFVGNRRLAQFYSSPNLFRIFVQMQMTFCIQMLGKRG